ncbi:hypothetical protein NXT3_PB00274 (plasmid) [Sinorhizobium fredii]|uniref:Uncharacterized protein n=1 Tax=Rhizobium fredii TaxID=380 RepID=A0A2L0HCN9_RHIFR|nr:hypothetical protein NXT3_PB00274 [Sinorhizobium fredii]
MRILLACPAWPTQGEDSGDAAMAGVADRDTQALIVLLFVDHANGASASQKMEAGHDA